MNGVSVRLACLEDAEQFIKWRHLSKQPNKDITPEYRLSPEYKSFLGEVIGYLTSRDRNVFMAFYEGKPLGCARFEVGGGRIREPEIVVLVDDTLQGRGLSKPMLQAVIDCYLKINKEVVHICAYVGKDNERSMKMLESVGFTYVRQDIHRQRIYEYKI